MGRSKEGKVIKIHSDYYYVKSENMLFECRIREKLKKEKVQVLVGDNVKLDEVNMSSSQAAISEVYERKNYIPRPSVANVDQVVIVASFAEPDLDFVQLDRYICQAKLYNVPAVICINKSDLEDGHKVEETISSIYSPLGYQIIFTCAIDGTGVDDLKNLLGNKVSVMCGMSGVGKSSLLNRLSPELSLKTKKVSAKTKKGIHTTRHVELVTVPTGEGVSCQVADTPGFSYLKFDTVMPKDLKTLFPEIEEASGHCYFSDCLHLEEENCNVAGNLDKIAPSRYESYKIFLKESFDYKEKVSHSSQKEESGFKTLDSSDNSKTRFVKLGARAREKSRRAKKQKMKPSASFEEELYEDLD